MLKQLSPASWTLIFMMLVVSLYLHAQKISKANKPRSVIPVGASLLHK